MKRALFVRLLACLLLATGAAEAAGESAPSVVISAASTNATGVQSGATRLTAFSAINTTATLVYVHIYDVAGTPNCAATGAKHIIPVPASATGNGMNLPITEPELYVNGFGFCITGAGTDGDTSNAVAGVYVNYAIR